MSEPILKDALKDGFTFSKRNIEVALEELKETVSLMSVGLIMFMVGLIMMKHVS